MTPGSSGRVPSPDGDPEDHATKSRDYGRGFAEAIRQVRAVINAHGITFEEDHHV